MPSLLRSRGAGLASPRTILVIDDHALFRSGVAAMLSTAFESVVLLDFASLDEALASVKSVPTVVLSDIQLSGRSGLEGMGLIHRRWPSAQIVIVSAHDLPDKVDAALARGAAAFLSKTERLERMIAVLRAMLEEPPVAPQAEKEDAAAFRHVKSEP